MNRVDYQAEHFIDATESLALLANNLVNQAQQKTILVASQAFLLCVHECMHNIVSTASTVNTVNSINAINAATNAAQQSVQIKAIWQVESESADKVCLIPSADKGRLRVQNELKGAYNALVKYGIAYIAMHKDLGAKYYEKLAKRYFETCEVIAKDKGWRLLKCVKGSSNALLDIEFLNFRVLALDLFAETGVFSAGKLDDGTALLLKTLNLSDYQGKRVLELGCGYGIIALQAALARAKVTAVDDDILAVQSTIANAKKHNLNIRTLHSDINSAFNNNEVFDVVLTNPPFHTGKKVNLDVPRAFLEAAFQHLSARGKLVLVANKDLPYEKELADWGKVEMLNADGRFKIVCAWK